MGVSGAGKSTVGGRLAAELGWAFLDGDDLHPAANIAKMKAGIPLTDADRAPWLAAIGDGDRPVGGGRRGGRGGVLRLEAGLSRPAAGGAAPVELVHLGGERDLLAARLEHRTGHFMPPAMLGSQLATLEAPAPEERAIPVDISWPLARQTGAIVAALRARGVSLAPHRHRDALTWPRRSPSGRPGSRSTRATPSCSPTRTGRSWRRRTRVCIDRDTRLISSWRIYANGAPWNLLNSANIAYFASRVFLLNRAIASEAGDIPAGALAMTLSRTIGHGLHEDLDLVNHGAIGGAVQSGDRDPQRLRGHLRGEVGTDRPPWPYPNRVVVAGPAPGHQLRQRRLQAQPLRRGAARRDAGRSTRTAASASTSRWLPARPGMRA